ncbi:MAG: hypothetical protein IPK12_06830 [Gemmatimonadetes bacterium]|nr:hypothetical protein [Gemmatimonadota bacterium]
MIRPLRARHRRLILASFIVALAFLAWGLLARRAPGPAPVPAELRAGAP